MQKAERSGLPTADRQAVLRTTKVRATLKGDQSWIQHRSTSQEQEDEKPWITEVRERRNNGALAEPTVTSTPSERTFVPCSPNSPRPVSPGYLIRGVFTKTDSQKDPSSSSANSHGSSYPMITKKSTDDYKKIAPHGVRHQLSGATQDEPTVSPEEHSKRTEAASSVLRTSGTKQRSYVLSAAKKYESIEKTQSSDVQPALSFKAKRVEFNDEDERSKSPEGSTRPIAPVPEPQKTPPVPQPKPDLYILYHTSLNTHPLTDEALVKPVTPKRDSCKQDPSPVADRETQKKSTQTQKPAMDSKTAVTLEQLAADVIPIDTSTKRYWRAEGEGHCDRLGYSVTVQLDLSHSSSDTKTVSSTSTVTPTVTKTRAPQTPRQTSLAQRQSPPLSPRPDTKAVSSSTNTVTPAVTKTSSSDTKTVSSSTSTVTPAVTKTSSLDSKTDPSGTSTVTSTVTNTRYRNSHICTISLSSSDTKTNPFSTNVVTPAVTKTSSSDTKTNPFSNNTVTPSVTKTSSSDTKTNPFSTTTTPSTVTKTSLPLPLPLLSLSCSSADPGTPLVDVSPPKAAEKSTKIQTLVMDKTGDPLDKLADSVIPRGKEGKRRKRDVDVWSNQPSHAVDSASLGALKEQLDTILNSFCNPNTLHSSRKWGVFLEERKEKITLFWSQSTTPSPPGTCGRHQKGPRLSPMSLRTGETHTHTPCPVLYKQFHLTQQKLHNDPPLSPFSVTVCLSLSTYRSYSFADETHKKEPLSTHSRLCGSCLSELRTPLRNPSQTLSSSRKPQQRYSVISSEDDSPWDRWMSPVISDSFTDRSETDGQYHPVSQTDRSETDSHTEADRQHTHTHSLHRHRAGQRFKETYSLQVGVTDIVGKLNAFKRSIATTSSMLIYYRKMRSFPEPSLDSLDSDIKYISIEQLDATLHVNVTLLLSSLSFDPYSRTLETSYTRSDSPESTESKKGYVYVKEYVNTTEMSKSFTDDITPSSVSYAYSSPTSTYRSVTMTPCTYCGELVGEDAKITVEHLNISCHPRCFKCGVCSKPMGDLLGSMFLHGGLVHCSSCYENV
uniref:LIM zinc-binding domain-containing protein n=1 Tax=Lepisosteus oculatus TaxID=7918 RepID=W5NC93_LEPOC